jgi:hypothetical protein
MWLKLDLSYINLSNNKLNLSGHPYMVWMVAWTEFNFYVYPGTSEHGAEQHSESCRRTDSMGPRQICQVLLAMRAEAS